MEPNDTIRSSSARSELARKRYFGRYLRTLRETYNERLRQPNGDEPVLRSRPTVTAVTSCMRESGFDITVTAYSEIENGINVPRDAARFLEVVTRCLRLSNKQYHELAERLAYDILSVRMGATADKVYPAKPEWNEE